MERVEDITIHVCNSSKFVQPYRVNYCQNGKLKTWDCIKSHNSVSVLIYNQTRKAVVLVRQFRPAVYMARHKEILQDSGIFSTTLSQKTSNGDTHPVLPVANLEATTFGPAVLGCTLELCAGIVDKATSLEKITKEEILEETGYDVPLESIHLITSFNSSVGIEGSVQHMYYVEVTDEMLVGRGGGNDSEGELIDVVYVPVDKTMELLFDATKPRTSGLCFAIMWFEHFKKPHLA